MMMGDTSNPRFYNKQNVRHRDPSVQSSMQKMRLNPHWHNQTSAPKSRTNLTLKRRPGSADPRFQRHIGKPVEMTEDAISKIPERISDVQCSGKHEKRKFEESKKITAQYKDPSKIPVQNRPVTGHCESRHPNFHSNLPLIPTISTTRTSNIEKIIPRLQNQSLQPNNETVEESPISLEEQDVSLMSMQINQYTAIERCDNITIEEETPPSLIIDEDSVITCIADDEIYSTENLQFYSRMELDEDMEYIHSNNDDEKEQTVKNSRGSPIDLKVETFSLSSNDVGDCFASGDNHEQETIKTISDHVDEIVREGEELRRMKHYPFRHSISDFHPEFNERNNIRNILQDNLPFLTNSARSLVAENQQSLFLLIFGFVFGCLLIILIFTMWPIYFYYIMRLLGREEACTEILKNNDFVILEVCREAIKKSLNLVYKIIFATREEFFGMIN